MTCTSQDGELRGAWREQNIFLESTQTHENSQIPAWLAAAEEAMSYLVNWIWARKVLCQHSGSQNPESSNQNPAWSTGVQRNQFLLPTQSRQGSPSVFSGQ